jgi:ATP-binding cassette subfamily F protein 3
MGVLSGGERSRAVLAGLLSSTKNLLVLDEPTNHLDIPAAERLEDVLEREVHDPNTGETRGGAYEGTLILISHDRALLDATCDRLIVLDGRGGAQVWLGTFSEWEKAGGKMRFAEEREPAARETPKASPKPEPKQEPKPEARGGPKSDAPVPPAKPASGGKRGKLGWMPVDRLEKEIESRQSRLGAIDKDMADPEVWRDHERANALAEERDRLRGELDEFETEWLRRME